MTSRYLVVQPHGIDLAAQISDDLAELLSTRDGFTRVNPMALIPAGACPVSNLPTAVQTVRDAEGNILSTWGATDPCATDGFSAPHGMWVDSHGDIYVGEVTHTALSGFYKRTTWHEGCATLRKFVRI